MISNNEKSAQRYQATRRVTMIGAVVNVVLAAARIGFGIRNP